MEHSTARTVTRGTRALDLAELASAREILAARGGELADAVLRLTQPHPTASPSDDVSHPMLLLAAAQLLTAAAFDAFRSDDYAFAEGAVAASAGARSLTRQRLDVAIQAQAVANSAMATHTAAIARFAAVEERVVDPDTGVTEQVERQPGHCREFCDTEVAAALRLGPISASRRVREAALAVSATPTLLTLAGTGLLESRQISAVGAELVEADRDVRAAVEGMVIEDGITEWTPRQTQRRTRAIVEQVDAEMVREIARRRMRERIGVWFDADTCPGLIRMTAIMPTADAAKIRGAVDEYAHDLRRATAADDDEDGRGDADARGNDRVTGRGAEKLRAGEARAQALTDLVTDGCTVTYQVSVQIPIVADVEPILDVAERCVGDTKPNLVRPILDDMGRILDDVGPDLDDTGPSPEHTETRPDWDGWLQELVADTDTRTVTGGGQLVTCRALAGSVANIGTLALPNPGALVGGDLLGMTSSIPAIVATDQLIGHIPGLGTIPPGAVAEILNEFGVQISRALLDEQTGVMIETGAVTYRPPTRIATFVRQRDRHCRFPGCCRPAEQCDLDHVQEWPRGRTAPDNLQLLCRYHHRAKTHGGWRVTMTEQGVCRWVSPSGREYLTCPATD